MPRLWIWYVTDLERQITVDVFNQWAALHLSMELDGIYAAFSKGSHDGAA